MFQRIRNTLAKELERDELVLLVGVGLVTAGLWPVLHVSALVMPGAVAVWMALPSRRPFFDRPADDPPQRRQT